MTTIHDTPTSFFVQGSPSEVVDAFMKMMEATTEQVISTQLSEDDALETVTLAVNIQEGKDGARRCLCTSCAVKCVEALPDTDAFHSFRVFATLIVYRDTCEPSDLLAGPALRALFPPQKYAFAKDGRPVARFTSETAQPLWVKHCGDGSVVFMISKVSRK